MGEELLRAYQLANEALEEVTPSGQSMNTSQSGQTSESDDSDSDEDAAPSTSQRPDHVSSNGSGGCMPGR